MANISVLELKVGGGGRRGGIRKLPQQNQRARGLAIPEPSGFLVCGMRLSGR